MPVLRMADPRGFLKHDRKVAGYRALDQRVQDFREVNAPLATEELVQQAGRCMDCGTPFCHGDFGCPLGNRIPIWNELFSRGHLADALAQLHATNNLPEITGRVCPAPCEAACCLGYNWAPVTIKQIECAIIDHAWEAGLVKPRPPQTRTGKNVAVVGSGPSGLAAAHQLNKAGHSVTVYERAERIGGLLSFGIPNFKLGREHLDRRLALLEAEGVVFHTCAEVGGALGRPDVVQCYQLREAYDAIVLCGGSSVARELEIPGRTLGGIFRAMDYLTRENKVVAGELVPHAKLMDARGKDVVVIGGGDTGSDCIGTAVRRGAKSVTQLEILPQPPPSRTDQRPWPLWPGTLSVSSSHEEAEEYAGLERVWSVSTKEFIGKRGRVAALRCVKVEWEPVPGGRPNVVQVPDSEFEIQADLVLLAMGFLYPERGGMLDQFGVELDERGNVRTGPVKMSSVGGVFAAGDMRRGQSLVVWAIAEGRDVAHDVDAWLMGESMLPRATPLP